MWAEKCGLFERNRPHDEGDVRYVGLGYVKGLVCGVVGDEADAALPVGMLYAFNHNALTVSTDYVYAVPLEEEPLVDLLAGHDVSAVELRGHGVALDTDQEVRPGELSHLVEILYGQVAVLLRRIACEGIHGYERYGILYNRCSRFIRPGA